MFSQRTAWDTEENDATRDVRLARAAGLVDFDLTVSNPTACCLGDRSEGLLAPLADARAMVYAPDPLGMREARNAVGQYYADHGICVEPGHICLTTSTSEAYSYLFRMLCDVGDEVLIARPSYPLFEFIAQLDGVRMVEYPLFYSDGWSMHPAEIERAITERTKAIVVVHPNNPTGNFINPVEREALYRLCARHKLALIVDEVFLDYPLGAESGESFAGCSLDVLTFVLSGLSKVCALPQMKVSWMVATGPDEQVASAMSRLEFVADTFLSVNAPMQYALGQWLKRRHDVQREITQRLADNLQALDELLRGREVSRLALDAGWAVILKFPRDGHPAERAMQRGVIVQPGGFYGLGQDKVVLSLLTPPDLWRAGLRRMLS